MDMQQAVSARTPAHLWAVGILALLWNAFACVDYLMSRMHNVGYLKAMMPTADPAVAFGFMDSMPLYASVGWGLGVWGGLLGAILLLVRSRYAAHAFLLSLIGMALSFGWQLFVATNVPAGMDNPAIPAVIVVIGLFLLWYAARMSKAGVLR
jgi:hypothetical protein